MIDPSIISSLNEYLNDSESFNKTQEQAKPNSNRSSLKAKKKKKKIRKKQVNNDPSTATSSPFSVLRLFKVEDKSGNTSTSFDK